MLSIAYAFPVTACDPDRLNDWDNKIGSLIKHKFKSMKSTPLPWSERIKKTLA